MHDKRELVEYLRDNRKKFTFEQLRAGLLEQGADPAILDEAIREVSAEKPSRLRAWMFYALAAAFPVFWLGYNFLPRTPRRAAAAAAADVAKAEVEAEAPAPPAAASPLDAARAKYHKDFFDPYAHVELSDELYKAGLLEDSFYVLEEARGFFPKEDFEAAHGFTIVGKHGGGWPGAGRFDGSPAHESDLKARAAADPADWESLSYLAHIAGHNGDDAAAEAYVDRALKIAPGEAGPLGLKAHLLAKRNDEAGALKAFEKVFALAPDSEDGRGALELMAALASKGKKGGAGAKRAKADLEAAAVSRPEDAEVWLALAFVRGASGDVAGIRSLVRGAEKARPGSPALDAVKGLLAISDKRVPEAVALLEKALARDPWLPYALEKLAQLHRKDLKDMAGALPYYIALHRRSPHYYDGEFAEDRIKRELERQRTAALASAKTAQDAQRLMSSTNGATRAEACLFAGKLGDPAVIGALADRLDDEVGAVVQNADNALYRLAKVKPAEIAAAKEKIVNDPRTFVRGMALNLYCDLDKPAMRATALARLSDPDSYVRFRAQMSVASYYAGDAEAQIVRKTAYEAERDQNMLKALRFLEEKRGSR
jgi:tetratricopeptide (TPR) repeat protein